MKTTYRLTAVSTPASADLLQAPLFPFVRRIGGALALVGLLIGSAPQVTGENTQWSGLGHSKRYLRINEYLFNGTQKVTAIAWRVEAEISGHMPS